MSFEQLLLLLILVAVPLLERLLRVVRERAGESMRDGAPTATGSAGAPPRPPRPAPDAGRTAPPPLLMARPLPALPARPAAGPQSAPPAARRALLVRRRAAVRQPLPGGDLRRAMMLLAILEPCRAISPAGRHLPGDPP